MGQLDYIQPQELVHVMEPNLAFLGFTAMPQMSAEVSYFQFYLSACLEKCGTCIDGITCSTCSKITTEWSSGSTCNTYEFLDISQYNDIIDPNVYPIRSNRATIGFWASISDMVSFSVSGKVINLVITDLMVMSFGSVSATDINLYCTVVEKTNPQAKLETTISGLEAYINQSTINKAANMKSTISSSNAQWFYARCGVNYENQIFFNYGQIKSVTFPSPVVTQAIPKEYIVKSLSTTTINRNFERIYKNYEFSTFSILNARLTNSPVYIKNIVVFQEYIPYNFEYQHL